MHDVCWGLGSCWSRCLHVSSNVLHGPFSKKCFRTAGVPAVCSRSLHLRPERTYQSTWDGSMCNLDFDILYIGLFESEYGACLVELDFSSYCFVWWRPGAENGVIIQSQSLLLLPDLLTTAMWLHFNCWERNRMHWTSWFQVVGFYFLAPQISPIELKKIFESSVQYSLPYWVRVISVLSNSVQ